MDLGDNSTTITLHQAAALASQVTEVLLYCSCKQGTSCGTKQCKCFKLGHKCTNYCHRASNKPEACQNLAREEDQNTHIMVPRALGPASSISTPTSTAPNTSDSDSTVTQHM